MTCSVTILMSVESFRMFCLPSRSHLEQPLLLSSPATIVAASYRLQPSQNILSSKKLLPIAHTVTCIHGDTISKISHRLQCWWWCVWWAFWGCFYTRKLQHNLVLDPTFFFPCLGTWRHSFLCKQPFSSTISVSSTSICPW
jgi:hypothetical protein